MARKRRKDPEDILASKKGTMKIVCPNCGRKVHFYAYEKKDKQLCDWCGRYVFKDKLTELKYRTLEAIRKKKNKK